MIKQCAICGKDFETKGNGKVCSAECRRVLYKATQSIRDKLKRIDKGKTVKPFCCICGKTFKPKFYREHFCSDECRYNSPLYRHLMDEFSEAGL